MFDTCIGPTMVTGWETTLVFGETEAAGIWKNTGVVMNCAGRVWAGAGGPISGDLWRVLFGTATTVGTMAGETWAGAPAAELIGLEVTKTVI